MTWAIDVLNDQVAATMEVYTNPDHIRRRYTQVYEPETIGKNWDKQFTTQDMNDHHIYPVDKVNVDDQPGYEPGPTTFSLDERVDGFYHLTTVQWVESPLADQKENARRQVENWATNTNETPYLHTDGLYYEYRQLPDEHLWMSVTSSGQTIQAITGEYTSFPAVAFTSYLEGISGRYRSVRTTWMQAYQDIDSATTLEQLEQILAGLPPIDQGP